MKSVAIRHWKGRERTRGRERGSKERKREQGEKEGGGREERENDLATDKASMLVWGWRNCDRCGGDQEQLQCAGGGGGGGGIVIVIVIVIVIIEMGAGSIDVSQWDEQTI